MQECKDIRPKDNNGNAHGYWEVYRPDGNLWYKGNYFHGKTHGYWEGYNRNGENGELCYKGKYDMDQKIGLWNINDKSYFYVRM